MASGHSHPSLSVSYYLIDQSILFCLLRAHYSVAFYVALYDFDILAAVFGEYLACQLAHSHDFFGVNPDISCLARDAPYRRLVN
jgi:hypothetical protein